MSNYIQQLQLSKMEANQHAQTCYDHMNDLIEYLYSPKFATDTTVQVNDVLRRLEPIRSALADVIYVTKAR